MLAELSLATLNMLTILFVVTATLFLCVGITAAVSFMFSYESSCYDSEEKKAERKARRRPCLILLIASALLMLGSVAVAAWAGTAYSVRHDTNVPQRIDRSEIKVDSNAPTGVIIDSR